MSEVIPSIDKKQEATSSKEEIEVEIKAWLGKKRFGEVSESVKKAGGTWVKEG
ncbi:MAG: hypothetical protein QXH91_08465 [Candidatus Bathyarchaeia archaeon]